MESKAGGSSPGRAAGTAISCRSAESVWRPLWVVVSHDARALLPGLNDREFSQVSDLRTIALNVNSTACRHRLFDTTLRHARTSWWVSILATVPNLLFWGRSWKLHSSRKERKCQFPPRPATRQPQIRNIEPLATLPIRRGSRRDRNNLWSSIPSISGRSAQRRSKSRSRVAVFVTPTSPCLITIGAFHSTRQFLDMR